MAKASNSKTLTDQVNEIISKTGESIDTSAAKAHSEMKQLQLADEIAASTDDVETALAAQALTPEMVEDRIVALCMGANHVFFDPEQRQEADNGYFYRLDYNDWDKRDDGARPTGNIVTVDRLSFLGGQVARGICQTLDNMLNAQPKGRFRGGLKARGNALRSQIQSTIAFGHNAGADMAGELTELERKLANNVEQVALVEIALGKAVECYHSITGQFYQSATDRAEAAKANAKALDPEQKARLAKLGVSI